MVLSAQDAPAMSLDPNTRYRLAMDQQGFHPDPAQAAAVAALQACHEALRQGTDTKGVYLWGAVGRGKTWLMDLFHASLPVSGRRQHFHHFMAWVHRRLFQLNGTADPLRALAFELSQEIRVLCFDELFVSDIGDAIILGRLFQTLFDRGVMLVATSNQPPDQLYQDGFNRERFLPAIAAMQANMQVLCMAGQTDHRQQPGIECQRYWLARPGSATQLAPVFDRLGGGEPGTTQPLQLGARTINVVRRNSCVIWCRFAELCEQPLATSEFMALCDTFQAILVDGVPALGAAQRAGRIARGTEDGACRVEAGERELPALSARDDSVRRFIALVDECYDRRVPLYLEAEVELEALYGEGYLTFAFRRTLSRLRKMQLQRFA